MSMFAYGDALFEIVGGEVLHLIELEDQLVAIRGHVVGGVQRNLLGVGGKLDEIEPKSFDAIFKFSPM